MNVLCCTLWAYIWIISLSDMRENDTSKRDPCVGPTTKDPLLEGRRPVVWLRGQRKSDYKGITFVLEHMFKTPFYEIRITFFHISIM